MIRERAVAWLKRRRALVVPTAGGVVFALASPPTDFYPCIVLGLALLAASVVEAPRARAAAGRALVWGTAAQIVGLRFVPEVIARFTPLPSAAGYLALALLSAAQSIPWAIGMTVTSVFARRLRAPLEIAFPAGVTVALSLPSIFAWSPGGLFTPWPSLVQLGDLIGERGVSALFALVAALVARAGFAVYGLTPGDPWTSRSRPSLHRNALGPLGGAAALVAALSVYGTIRMRAVAAEAAPTAALGLVDQAVSPLDRWNPKLHAGILAKLRALTASLEGQGAELAVWPEAAYPYLLDHAQPRILEGSQSILRDGVKGPVLFGTITRGRRVDLGDGQFERDSYNSTTLLSRDGALALPADKLELLWFGETVPLGDVFPWLRRLFQRSGGLVAGEAPRALELTRESGPALRMAILNCYEDTLTGVGRRVARDLEPNLLVNVTNDAWFYGTAESELHARLGAMRAVETRRDLVRAVNDGVMTWVDATGAVRARYDAEAPGVLLVTPALHEGAPTLYVRFGNAPLTTLFALLALAYAARELRRRRDEAARTPRAG